MSTQYETQGIHHQQQAGRRLVVDLITRIEGHHALRSEY